MVALRKTPPSHPAGPNTLKYKKSGLDTGMIKCLRLLIFEERDLDRYNPIYIITSALIFTLRHCHYGGVLVPKKKSYVGLIKSCVGLFSFFFTRGTNTPPYVTKHLS